jgi:hypothetical protein
VSPSAALHPGNTSLFPIAPIIDRGAGPKYLSPAGQQKSKLGHRPVGGQHVIQRLQIKRSYRLLERTNNREHVIAKKINIVPSPIPTHFSNEKLYFLAK